MTRHRAHLTGLAAALMVALTACGGGNPSAKTSTSPSASPTASATTSTAPSPKGPPPQPKGKYGVTVDILNWDKYANDPVVLAAKRVTEDVQASANRGKLVPGLLDDLGTMDVRRLIVANTQNSARKGYHVSKRMVVRVAARKGALVTLCFWMPSYDYRTKSGRLYQGPENYWGRFQMKFKKTGSKWKLAKVSANGRCPGGAPR